MPASPARRPRRIVPADVVPEVDPAAAYAQATGQAPEVAEEVPAAFAPKPRKPRAKSAARQVQAAVADPKTKLPEGKRVVETDEGPKAPLGDKYFRVVNKVGTMPLMEWASVADGSETSRLVQLASFHRLLKATVHPDDWDAFRKHATEQTYDDTPLYDFLNAAIEAMAARPTQEPATS